MIPKEKIQSLKAEHTELKKEIYDTAKMSVKMLKKNSKKIFIN
jgi:rRNA processing protein Krr1/Pno1